VSTNLFPALGEEERKAKAAGQQTNANLLQVKYNCEK
jgi:hypothetical protein